MKWIDKILLVIAAFCLVAIILIIETDDSTYAMTARPIIKQLNNVKSLDSDEMIIYSKEIDLAIEKYFEAIRKDPVRAEEELRIVEDLKVEPLSSGIEIVDSQIHTEKGIKLPDEDSVKGRIVRLPSLKKLPNPKKQINLKKLLIVNHRVVKGESLWRIAQKYKVPIYTIISANPNISRKIIQPGELIKVPTKKGVFHKVKKGQSLSLIATKYKVTVAAIMQANNLRKSIIHIGQKIFLPGAKPKPQIRYINRKIFILPLRGRLTSSFGWRKHPFKNSRQFHPGLDLGAKYGSRIKASASGIVVYAGKAGEYGNLILLRHKGGFLTAYAHCSKLLVKKGRYVKQGSVIAKVGSTGTSTGPHLHFEVRKYKRKINPYSAFKLTERIKLPLG